MLRQFGKTKWVGENKEVNKICGCCEENCCCPRPCYCCSAVSRVRLRDHGAWPGILQSFIFLSRIFYLAFSILHFLSCICYLAFSISQLAFFYLTSRIFISHLAFLCRISLFLSRIRIFILHFPPDFFSFLT